MIPELDTAERVHYAMLRGEVHRITMSQCAHTWGAKAVEEYNYADQLRGDLKTVSDVLIDYDGETPWQQAQAAVTRIQWLTDELILSKVNELAARKTALQNQVEIDALDRELERARLLLANCATIMRVNDPLNARDIFGPEILTEPNEEGFTDVEQARQTTGPTGPQQERPEGQKGQ